MLVPVTSSGRGAESRLCIADDVTTRRLVPGVACVFWTSQERNHILIILFNLFLVVQYLINNYIITITNTHGRDKRDVWETVYFPEGDRRSGVLRVLESEHPSSWRPRSTILASISLLFWNKKGCMQICQVCYGRVYQDINNKNY